MSTIGLICGLAGCGNPRSPKSTLCDGHTKLRSWLRRGGELAAFIALHDASNRNHGRPVCSVLGCGRRQTRGSGYCGNHQREKRKGIPFSENTQRLTDFSLPISLEVTLRKPPQPRKDRSICPIPGCGKPRKFLHLNHLGHAIYSHKCEEHTAPRPIPAPKVHVRGVCAVPGCGRPQEIKENCNGQKRYFKVCCRHRRPGNPVQYRVVKASASKAGANLPTFIPINPIRTDHCSICGWDGPCDKHRMKAGKDGGTYERGNIVVVCPNCHRLLHRGIDPKTRLPLKEAVA